MHVGENLDISSIDLNVKQLGEPTRVNPAKETEKILYFLSNLDQNLAVPMRTVYCFKTSSRGNEDAARVIKDALTMSSETKLIVDNTGKVQCLLRPKQIVTLKILET